MKKLTFKCLDKYRFLIAPFVTILFCLCLSFPSQAANKSGSCGENLTWTLTGDILIINGSGDMTDYADGAFAPWFGVAKDIRTIALSNEMTSVGDYAFTGCANVTNIVIPESVIEIGECAFAQCRNLQYLDLGNHLQIIGEGAFQECELLLYVEIPASVKEVRANAFYRCYSMLEGNIPKNVEILGESVFSYCTDMVRASIHAPIEELPGWTFYGCSSLADVSLAPEVVTAGDYAFLFCESLNGIYSQDGNVETVHSLEESIYSQDGAPKEGLLKAYEMPKYSIVETDDGKTYAQIKAIGVESVLVSIRLEKNYEDEQRTEKLTAKAMLFNENDWLELSEIVKESLDYSKISSMDVEIYTKAEMIASESLTHFVGKPVKLQIYSKDGNVWEIDMSQAVLQTFTGQYDLVKKAAESAEKEAAVKEMINNMGSEEKNETSEAASDVVFEPYDPEKAENSLGESHLVDENGTTYYVTGRSSKWGITGKEFSLYVGLWIASAVLIVAVVMLSLNQKKKSQEQYEELVKQGEAEDAAAQEALQVELLKEMLNKED